MTITRDQLLKPISRQVREVDVPELGGSVFVRSLTEAERTDFEVSVLTEDGGKDRELLKQAKRLLVVLCACDKTGTTLLTPADLEALSQQNAVVINRIFDAAAALNGLTDEDIEKLVKN